MPAQTGQYTNERKIAELAVQRATILTKNVFRERTKGTLQKEDLSPVTIGDFGSQALVIKALRSNFLDDSIVAEEEAEDLRKDHSLPGRVWEFVSRTRLLDPEAEAALGGGILSIDEMTELVDLGRSGGGAQGRFWTLDPIDGTKGFIRGGQYAVCLALIVDGEVVVGVLGCPNLSEKGEQLAQDGSFQGEGALFSASASQGAGVRPLSTGALHPDYQPLSTGLNSRPSLATYCASFEGAHAPEYKHSAVATKLGITKPPLRIDSQAKYAAVACGAIDVYLRLARDSGYIERIWDHAAGDLIVRESGGKVTDAEGKRLDFSKGRTLAANTGLVAASKPLHSHVLQATKEVLSETNAQWQSSV